MRGSAADIDHGGRERGGRGCDQGERGLGRVLIPAHLLLGLRLIGPLPVLLAMLGVHRMLRSTTMGKELLSAFRR